MTKLSKPIIYPITLDMRRNLHQVIVMKENDANSRIIEAKITDNGQLYELVSNDCVAIKWYKPDGHVIHNIAYIITEKNTIEIVCTEQMLCVAGISEAEIVIYKDDSILSTMNFNISINKSVASNYIIESSDEFGLLNKLITDEKNAEYYANHSTQMANLAESYAKGTNGSVRENDITDNARYYYEQAKAHVQAIGGILYMGTKTFSELSLPENQEPNYLFNISEEFTSDETFKDGAGIKYSMGTNVCRTADGFWDVFVGIESFGTGEIVTESIEDEPLDQDEGEYWIFNY